MRQHKNIEHRQPPASTWVTRLKPAAAALPLGQMRRGLAPGNTSKEQASLPLQLPPTPQRAVFAHPISPQSFFKRLYSSLLLLSPAQVRLLVRNLFKSSLKSSWCMGR